MKLDGRRYSLLDDRYLISSDILKPIAVRGDRPSIALGEEAGLAMRIAAKVLSWLYGWPASYAADRFRRRYMTAEEYAMWKQGNAPRAATRR